MPATPSYPDISMLVLTQRSFQTNPWKWIWAVCFECLTNQPHMVMDVAVIMAWYHSSVSERIPLLTRSRAVYVCCYVTQSYVERSVEAFVFAWRRTRCRSLRSLAAFLSACCLFRRPAPRSGNSWVKVWPTGRTLTATNRWYFWSCSLRLFHLSALIFDHFVYSSFFGLIPLFQKGRQRRP